MGERGASGTGGKGANQLKRIILTINAVKFVLKRNSRNALATGGSKRIRPKLVSLV